jgi:antitoxin (DNA-binding transcriptional repressor) of toxin-antitoxin stability system
MRTVNIVELKNGLGAYLEEVRAGEEIIIRDCDLPIAKIVPLDASESTPGELAQVASGELKLPSRAFDEESFFAVGAGTPVSPGVVEAAIRAISEDRDDRDAGILGQ